MAAHQASLCLYLSARHVVAAQAKLLLHYPADTPVAICYRLGWADERIRLVPLTEMAAVTAQENWIRSTMYLVSPALRAATVPVEYGAIRGASSAVRSRLYDSDHPRLFRP
jgi:precorrin-4/cobalt-precorrin-4 C11-methyltransferase